MAASILSDNRLTSIIRLSQRAFGQYRHQIITLIILGITSGILEGIGVNALIPLFSFLTDSDAHGTDFISQSIERFFGYLHLDFSVTWLLIFISILVALKAILTVFLEYVNTGIMADYEEKTRNNLFQNILQADWPHLIKQKLGYLETILMIDVPASARVLQQISSAILVSTSLLIYAVVAFNISTTVTLVAFAVSAVLFLVIKPLLYRIKVLGYERTQINKDTAHHVNENIFGIKTIKTMAVADGVSQKASDYFRRLRQLLVKASVIKAGITASIQPVGVIFISILFVFSYRLPNFNLAALLVLVYLVQRIFLYIEHLQRALHNLNDLVPHLRSTVEFEDQSVANQEMDDSYEAFSFNQQIDFRKLDFFYEENRPILRGISFAVKKGEMVGIIGPSGVGKTTLVDLVLRLLIPTAGKILLDGRDISTIKLSQWRKNIGYVSQEIFLMNDTFANNVRFYDNTITDDQIISAVQQANIYDFIVSCPDKLNTVIGERGILLSAGQRQRVVIARILARQPKILILDEATSALDNESELQIQTVIRQLKGSVTVLVIAHRLQTVMDSDTLIVLDHGRIFEQGKPTELMRKKDSYFFKMYNIRK